MRLSSRLYLIVTVMFSILLFFVFPKHSYAQNIIFEDDFETGTHKWTTIISDQWVIENGEYGVIKQYSYGRPSSLPSNEYWKEEWVNYSFDVDIRPVEGEDKNILLRYIDEANYISIHYNNRGFHLAQKQNDSIVFRADIKPENPMINGISYHFRGEILDNTVKFFYDGEPIFNEEFAGLFDSGRPGLRVSPGAEVWFDNVIIEEISLSPPTVPTSKVILTPGMGASWNPDALLNCKVDNYEGDWTLASFAEDIYNPLLSTLNETEFETFPFYYDWRKEIPENGSEIASFINQKTEDNEKTHFIGHSMGGLVGGAYIQSEGENNKLDKYLSIGSPHKGSAFAYPAWSGGKIWQDNFLAKIATSLLINRCKKVHEGLETNREVVQNIFPSTQNLLPFEQNYLKDKKTNEYIPIGGMNATNNWLPAPSSFFDVMVGTLSGTGFDTLVEIPTRDGNKRDAKLGNWIDGKPAGKIYSSEGDGTVLSSSSRLELEGVDNRQLNQTHSDLVSSPEGVSEIFDFLGITPVPVVPNPVEPKSALIVAGYPANFTVTDPEGKIKKDKNSLVSFINPKKGSYKITLLPESDNTLLMIGQILKNGKVKWKEYNLNGKMPKFGSVKFNPQELNENPLGI